jgi:peptide/nickel transport system ATP-binding protein
MSLEALQAHGSKTARLELREVTKVYQKRRRTTVALNRVSFSVDPGKIIALVGESGSGKTTIARIVTGIERPTSGTVQLGDWQVDTLPTRRLREYRRFVQMVFQDPFSSLNPHNTVLQTLMRPLINHRHYSFVSAREQAFEIMNTVRLAPIEQFANKKPHQLSGGQRQRLVIGRAIAPEPQLMVADEPVSMLDVSIRADVLYLIDELRRRTGMSVLYITHDLLSARAVADGVVVLYRGHVVERGVAQEVIRHAEHPYTRILINAIPNPRRSQYQTTNQGLEPVQAMEEDSGLHSPHDFAELDGALKAVTTVPTLQTHATVGCPFMQRCPYATLQCVEQTPSLQGSMNHQVACWHACGCKGSEPNNV